MDKLNIFIFKRFCYMAKARKIYIAAVILMTFLLPLKTIAQINQASSANWLFPKGNASGTRHIGVRSGAQIIDSMRVKWSTAEISGDVQPLIGNIINNGRLIDNFPAAPNEIVAVMGDSIVVLGAGGQPKKSSMPAYVKDVSVLIDTLATQVNTATTRPLILGLESIEFESPEEKLAFSYLAGFDHGSDTVRVLKRLAVDLRDYDPNYFASITPVFGKRAGGETVVFATVNMSDPAAPDPNPVLPPYFRGFTMFNTGSVVSTFPLPDVGDDIDYRVTVGPEVDFNQPSFTNLGGGRTGVALSCSLSPSLDVQIENPVTFPTFGDRPYLMTFDVTGSQVSEEIPATDISSRTDPVGSRPRIKSYYLNIRDANPSVQDSVFILVAEEYDGVDSSNGTARLHLYNSFGDALTFPGDPIEPQFLGGKDHHWSVAVGNVDGASANEWLPYYPNNPGREIIVTQSSREFAVAGSKLYVLRYYSNSDVPKPSPPNSILFPFDTLCSHRINGWVAAVNDLDGASDLKEEIILVDGSKIMIVRMNDYDSYNFRIGRPFDTVYTRRFDNQTISSVAVSDLEGDGLNDVVVTTHDSTYVIGSLITDIISMIEPVQQMTPPAEYCAGDTLTIRWENLMRGQKLVDIYFAPTQNGVPTGERILIEEAYPNDLDTNEYDYLVDLPVLGSEGMFVVASKYYPTSIYDRTAIMRFEMPLVSIDPLAGNAYRAGDEIEITGNASCVDSVAIEYSYDQQTWQRVSSAGIDPDGTFAVSGEAPCPDFFECLSEDADSILHFQVVSFRADYADTSDTVPVRILPARFPVEFDTCLTACPTKLFEWDTKDMKFACDTVSMSVSIDGGRSYSYVGSVPADEGSILWQVPTTLPDSVTLRFCCENSCIRIDTVLKEYKPEYISIIAPNPFKPPLETMEIIYEVPEETNVTIRIFDQNNRLVAEPVASQPRSPGYAYCDRWNGRIHNGGLAANGMYYLIMELSNGQKQIYPVYIRK
jgi:hypothetical protein